MHKLYRLYPIEDTLISSEKRTGRSRYCNENTTSRSFLSRLEVAWASQEARIIVRLIETRWFPSEGAQIFIALIERYYGFRVGVTSSIEV